MVDLTSEQIKKIETKHQKGRVVIIPWTAMQPVRKDQDTAGESSTGDPFSLRSACAPQPQRRARA